MGLEIRAECRTTFFFFLRMSVFFIAKLYSYFLYCVLQAHIHKMPSNKILFIDIIGSLSVKVFSESIAQSKLTSNSSQKMCHIWYTCACLHGHMQNPYHEKAECIPALPESFMALLVGSAPKLKCPSLHN